MKLQYYIQIAVENLFVNKLRSFLTLLGIIIGVFNVILVSAVLQVGREMILKEMRSFGPNAIYVYSEEGYLTEKDILTIERIPDVERIIPQFYIRIELRIDKKTEGIFLYGTSFDIKDINIDITEGRFFFKNDIDQKKKVCVIPERLKYELFKGLSPIGKELNFEGKIFVVIGVAKERGILSKMVFGDFIYIPFSTAQRILQTEKIEHISIRVKDVERVEEVTQKIEQILNKKPGSSFSVSNMHGAINTTRIVTGIIALIISLIAGISLVIGGIGITNIMLVQVRERTREIGIRKASGASNKDIFIQFLIESCILSLSGGVIGVILGLLVANIIALSLGLPFLINLWYIFVGFVVASLVGIFSGIYPAQVASKLSPIEALRYY